MEILNDIKFADKIYDILAKTGEVPKRKSKCFEDKVKKAICLLIYSRYVKRKEIDLGESEFMCNTVEAFCLLNVYKNILTKQNKVHVVAKTFCEHLKKSKLDVKTDFLKSVEGVYYFQLHKDFSGN